MLPGRSNSPSSLDRLAEIGCSARQAMLPRNWGRVVASFEAVASEVLAR